MPYGLIRLGNFTLHSGEKSNYLINAEALSNQQLDSLAAWAVSLYGKPARVVGVPNGGLRFAKALSAYTDLNPDNNTVWIADDVFTTGASISQMAQKVEKQEALNNPTILGIVIFSRSTNKPPWVRSLFTVG